MIFTKAAADAAAGTVSGLTSEIIKISFFQRMKNLYFVKVFSFFLISFCNSAFLAGLYGE
jgi:hypothetical protein